MPESRAVMEGRHIMTWKEVKGFTLVEVIIAILVFSIGIIGVAKMLGEAVKGGSFGMQYTDAVNIAQDRIEYLSGLSYTQTSLTAGTHTVTGIVSKTGTSYTATWVVQDNIPGTNMKQIAMTVSWAEKGISHDASISFIKVRS